MTLIWYNVHLISVIDLTILFHSLRKVAILQKISENGLLQFQYYLNELQSWNGYKTFECLYSFLLFPLLKSCTKFTQEIWTEGTLFLKFQVNHAIILIFLSQELMIDQKMLLRGFSWSVMIMIKLFTLAKEDRVDSTENYN